MSRAITFITGMIAGSSLIGLAANAHEPGWMRAANEVVDRHVNVHFAEYPPGPCTPPDPCRDDIRVDIAPISTAHTIVLGASAPPEPDAPPDPCFSAVLGNPPVGDRPNVTLRVLHPEQVSLVGPDGRPAQLCSPVADNLP